jgi:lactate dehydrogenase-like 2-hydroxyacid dehydrogenase
MKIFVTRIIPKPALDLLKKEHEIEVFRYDRIPTKDEIIRGLRGKDGLLCLLSDPVDKEVINSEPRLKMIATYAVGFDNIDIEAASKRKIPVSNTPGVLTEATAEMAWALLFSVARRIVEADKFTRSGKYIGWGPMLMLGRDISTRILGVVGVGRIGTSFAMKSKGFDMKVLYFDKNNNEILEKELDAKKVSLQKLLKESDFVSLHVPLMKSTYHLIGQKELEIMKHSAILINTSRGPVIDENALIKSLKEKRIFGAGLDVYENEPIISDELLKLDNVVLQPHSASATINSRTNMGLLAAKNMIAGLKGQIPPNCLNPGIFNQ